MPRISNRGKLMPNSPIRKLVPYAEEATKKGINVLKLNIGQPDIHTSQVALEAIRKLDAKVIDYGHSAGNKSLRDKFAGYYKGININVFADDILITTGEVVPISASIENGFALPSIGEFEKKITNRTKAIIICNPNNPTGYIYSKRELEQLRDLVLKYDLFLLADEVYRELCYDGEKFTSIMNIPGIEQNVILIDSVSKRYSATGFRVGALISKNKTLLETALKFCQARLSPPYFGQVAAEAAIDSNQDYLDSVYNEFLARRNYIIPALNNIPGVYCPMPKGAFYCIARLPVDDAEKFALWLLKEFQYNKYTVMLAPAAGFYYNTDLGKQEVRIAYVLNINDLKKAIDCLTKALEQYPGRLIEKSSEKIIASE